MFNRILKFFGAEPDSRTTAKNRLQLILVQDRMGLEASKLDDFRSDLISLVSQYFEINDSKVEIDLLREKEEYALVANVPGVSPKQRFKSASL